MSRGRFITLEGGEGAGKTTQLVALVDALTARGLTVVRTREPGGAPGAEEIRRLLVEGAPDRWDAISEALLHFAARRDHLRRTIWPALARGDWVISDRFVDSTMAYQGYGHELGRSWIATLQKFATDDFLPDLTVILDVPVAEGLRRASARRGSETRYERMDGGFHERIRTGFHDISKRAPRRCVLIDAMPPADTVAAAVLRAVRDRLAPP
ncbi:MAG: dTMP kinase [Alphaproteobacteria bacterium]